MEKSIQKFEYDNQVVEFEMVNGNLMVNVTEMAKIFGKRVDHFLKSDHAKEFIKVLELTPFGGSFIPLKRHEIIQTRNGVNTFFHKLLALKFAAWLDSKFELWVYQTIDEVMFGDYRRMQEELRLSAQRKNRIDELRNNLVASDEYCELVKLELEEKQAAYRRTKHNRMQLELFRTNLN